MRSPDGAEFPCDALSFFVQQEHAGTRPAWHVRQILRAREVRNSCEQQSDELAEVWRLSEAICVGGDLAAVLPYKFIAGTRNRDDQFRPLRIFFQLLSQASNMSIDRSRE